ncbi:MAG: metallophosphoesterase [Candidatus Poseidoniaceae archaeon]
MKKTLQEALENGKNVWVIGDVHGFNKTLRCLVEKINPQEGDYVVLLGDLIDRGPNSYDVVQFAKSSDNIVCVKGNHEKMMIETLSLQGLESPGIDLATWLYNGGLATATSYINAYTDKTGNEMTELLDMAIEEDKVWMNQLPSEIVLEKWRLVHAGYDPEIDLDCQTDTEMLHIRKPFHDATEPIDPQRTVVFGHTPTAGLPGHSKLFWGKVWFSPVLLPTARSAAIGLDTCVFHNLDAPAVLTAYNLQDNRIIQQSRVEPWNKRAIKQANEV